MRFTTFHTQGSNKREFKSKAVPGAALRMGEEVGFLLTDVKIPEADCPFAFASALIQVMGKDAHNDNGEALRSAGSVFWGQGRWVHTQLFIPTLGIRPSIHFSRNANGSRVWSDSFAGADVILDCFGLDMNKVLEHFGNVTPYERKVFDLATIIARMAPEILTSTRLAEVA